MALQPTWEPCHHRLEHEAKAFICRYECTFRATGITTMASYCPNRRGALLRRPRRAPRAVASSNGR